MIFLLFPGHGGMSYMSSGGLMSQQQSLVEGQRHLMLPGQHITVVTNGAGGEREGTIRTITSSGAASVPGGRIAYSYYVKLPHMRSRLSFHQLCGVFLRKERRSHRPDVKHKNEL